MRPLQNHFKAVSTLLVLASATRWAQILRALIVAAS